MLYAIFERRNTFSNTPKRTAARVIGRTVRHTGIPTNYVSVKLGRVFSLFSHVRGRTE